MFEKVNPEHPDKIADRIAGAIVDYAYTLNVKPKIAVEVLIGHDECNIIAETSEQLDTKKIESIVKRIAGDSVLVNFKSYPQDTYLAQNQEGHIKCGDNGIFIGCPTSLEESDLTGLVSNMHDKFKSDAKFLSDWTRTVICQSKATEEDVRKSLESFYPSTGETIVNPIGNWTGGINVDTGATNRKLGSDMGRAVSGGGLHGKDLSKADVSINIVCHLIAQLTNKVVKATCFIGDEYPVFSICNEGDTYELEAYKFKMPYAVAVQIAGTYINYIGGFEKFAEWGLIRPQN